MPLNAKRTKSKDSSSKTRKSRASQQTDVSSGIPVRGDFHAARCVVDSRVILTYFQQILRGPPAADADVEKFLVADEGRNRVEDDLFRFENEVEAFVPIDNFRCGIRSLVDRIQNVAVLHHFQKLDGVTK